MNWPLVLAILAVWTILGFTAWAFLTVGHEYREPITESDIKTLREEAERAASLTEARRCPWPIAGSFHVTRVTEGVPQDHV